MNKIHPISDEQIKILMSDIYRLNPPIQLWEAFNKFFQSLPTLPENKVEASGTEEIKND